MIKFLFVASLITATYFYGYTRGKVNAINNIDLTLIQKEAYSKGYLIGHSDGERVANLFD